MQYYNYDTQTTETFPEPPARLPRGSQSPPMAFEPTRLSMPQSPANQAFWVALMALGASILSLVAQAI